MSEAGLLLRVNGVPRRLRAVDLRDGPGELAVWTADVDGALGCGGTWDAAVLAAARNAALDNGGCGGAEVTQ